jgi:hypothetical protein
MQVYGTPYRRYGTQQQWAHVDCRNRYTFESTMTNYIETRHQCTLSKKECGNGARRHQYEVKCRNTGRAYSSVGAVPALATSLQQRSRCIAAYRYHAHTSRQPAVERCNQRRQHHCESSASE